MVVGTVEAATKASVRPLAPKRAAITCSRKTPRRRLATLPSMRIPAALAMRVEVKTGRLKAFPYLR